MTKDRINQAKSSFGKWMNKYTVTGFIFLLWIAFFDSNSMIDQMQLRSKIRVLEKEKEYYQQKIDEDNRKMEELVGSRDNLEKFAREQYLMKRPNEDIFVIVDK